MVLFRLIACFWCLVVGILLGLSQIAAFLLGSPVSGGILAAAAVLFTVGIIEAALMKQKLGRGGLKE